VSVPFAVLPFLKLVSGVVSGAAFNRAERRFDVNEPRGLIFLLLGFLLCPLFFGFLGGIMLKACRNAKVNKFEA
jgi:F0F1-type ATP synthase assembly protein I